MALQRSGRALSAAIATSAFAVALLVAATEAFACMQCSFGGHFWNCCIDSEWGGCCVQWDSGNPGHYWYGCFHQTTGICVGQGYDEW